MLSKGSGLPYSVLAALHLDRPRLDGIAHLDERGWRAVLGYCDRVRLTLWLRDAAADVMPQWVRERTGRDAANNRLRLDGIEALYRDMADWLGAAGIDFLALKGLTHPALFGGSVANRVQYDVDLWLPRQNAFAARDLLATRGYLPIEGMEAFPTDHLPALIRKTGWQFRGDFFDPEIPLPVELHFRFWNEQLERLPVPGTEEFWGRRIHRPMAGTEITMLHPADALAFASLHLLRHVLQGSANAFHGYEIALILDGLSGKDGFWREWRELHPPGLRRLEAVAFRLAREWFGGRAAAAVEEEIAQLPAATRSWFAEFAESPLTSDFSPNKDELWLHISLLESRRAAWGVARRRLLPGNLPPFADTAYVPDAQITWAQRARKWRLWTAYAAGRFRHHALSFPPTAISGARWWYRTNSLGEQFWIFLVTAVLFNFALFIFVLLYNLFLMDLGFREDFLGVVNGAARLGSVVGTLPAAWVAYRFGLRRTLAGVIAGVAVTEMLRAVIGARMPLAALAFASGCIFSVWAVIMAPLISGSVDEKRRPTAFSIFFACMFATGIFGNWLGGRLPQWMHGKQPVLLLSAAMSAIAIVPALRLQPGAAPPTGERVYPRSRFLALFLVPFALWHLATGAFNPFNNVYFRRLGFGDAQIGSILSGAQFVQVVAVLTAPLAIRRFGLPGGIFWMMAATAVSLTGLAAQPAGAAAIGAYAMYMSFQWMSEPGLNTLLMNHVAERERSGASALTYLVAFGAQAISALAAGEWATKFGWGPVLAGAAVLAVLAAGLFRVMLRD